MAFEGDNMMGVKKNNRATVLQLLHKNGSMSRKNLADKMHLTAAAITKIVGEMETEGIITEGAAIATGNAGRREILVGINKEYAVALGVHINIKKVIVSAVNLNGELLFEQTVSISSAAPADATIRTVASILTQLISEHNIDRSKIVGIGIAVRGHLSDDRRISSDSYGALSDKNYPICDRLEELTGFRTIMENNVRALHAAQMFLSKSQVDSTQMFLRCEYGIGSSISIEGRIWDGVNQSSGEIGHIPVEKEGGRKCNCGKTGCLETVASTTAIREILMENLSPEQTPVLWKLCQEKATAEPEMSDISMALEQNDPGVVKVVNRAVNELSAALETVTKILDPDSIVLYGRLFEEDSFIEILLHQFSKYNSSAIIEKSEYNCTLEDKAACLVAVNKFFDNGGIIRDE